jgi:dTDP-4-amino-4,6-dideoxy-D-galactose acyltransferase
MIKKLDWDSTFFGYPIGQCILSSTSDNLDEELFLKNTSEFLLTYIFSAYPLHSNLFALVDEKLVFEKKINKPISLVEPLVFFNPKIHIPSDLLRLVFLSGKYSRFNRDKKFENYEFEKLYTEWINKSLFTNTNSQIIVKFIDGKLAGFLSFSTDDITTKIELIAVDEDFQGKGIGSTLIGQVLSIACNHLCEKVEVVTQGLNSAAIHLYEKNNFTCINKTYIYHYWKR